MLNLNVPLANGPLPALATACPPAAAPATAASADDAPAFARALDQAAARQRDARGEGSEGAGSARPDDSGAPAEASAPPRSDAADARPAQGPRAAAKGRPDASRGAELRDATAPQDPARVDVDPVAALAQPGDDPALTATSDQAPAQPGDLAAWIANLPLPRPNTAALATPAAVRSEPAARAALARAAAEPAADALPGLGRALGRSAELPAGPPAWAQQPGHDPGRHGELRGARVVAQAQVVQMQAAAADKRASDAGTGLAGVDAVPVLQSLRDMLPVQRQGNDGLGALPMPPGAGLAARAPDSGLPLQAELKAPVGSNEFAPMLGSQLSVMVRDGVEHAQLKLNPAEMGPIEVRISLDGSQAQVDFSAAHAATRQALQDAVPALAGALRESGLTLTGGGVFEQAREQRGDARQDGPRQPNGTSGRAAEGTAASIAAARAPRARGVVDLYA
jgi:flagellar hook-length control protein FliK